MMTTIAAGDGSRIGDPRRTIVRDAAEWRALWTTHAGPQAASPAVDFTTHIVAAVFAGERPSAGYEIAITDILQKGAKFELVVGERRPPPGTMAAQMIVTPFHIVSLARPAGEVRFEDAGRPADSAAGQAIAPAGVTREAPGRSSTVLDRSALSSTGLAPHMAAALAYLAGPFSGILVLLAEQTSRFVRFHAWQSMLGLGGLGVLAVVFLLSAFAALLVSPAGFTFMYWLAFLTAVGWVILWAVCLVQAFNGRAWKLPVVGDVAERKSLITHR